MIATKTMSKSKWFLTTISFLVIILVVLSFSIEEDLDQIEPKVLSFAKSSKPIIDCIGVPASIRPKSGARTSSRVGRNWGRFLSTYLLTGYSGEVELEVTLTKENQEWQLKSALMICRKAAPVELVVLKL
jgi:hypothetical protein